MWLLEWMRRKHCTVLTLSALSTALQQIKHCWKALYLTNGKAHLQNLRELGQSAQEELTRLPTEKRITVCCKILV